MAVLIVPMIVAPAMMGLMYRLVLHEFVGPVPHDMFAILGWAPAVLSPANVFVTVVAAETMQWTPFAFLLILTACNQGPADLREAAYVDGARPARVFWKIDLPLMLPTLFVALFIRFIDVFRVFDTISTLVGAGPGGATTSMSIHIYGSFLRRDEIGQAMAAAVLLFAATFLLYVVARRAAPGRRG